MADESQQHFSKGNDFFQKQDYTKAIQCYTSAIQSNSKFARSYLFRGIVENKLKNVIDPPALLTRKNIIIILLITFAIAIYLY